MSDLLIKDIYETIRQQVPSGMDAGMPGKRIDHSGPNAQGDVNMYTKQVAEAASLGFAAGLGDPIVKSFTIVEGEQTRNDHQIFLDVDAVAFWNDQPNTRTDLECGVLTVTSGQAFLYHTAEHEPFTITAEDGPVLFTRSREMGEEIRKIQD